MCGPKYFRLFSLISYVIFIVLVSSHVMHADDYKTLLQLTVNNLNWRSIGPALDGGRVDDFAVVESNPHIIYCGTASGGLWKTINNGVTWKAIFDEQATSSIGDVTLSPSNPEIVWVGTGEANSRNSSSWGNGVYKSLDGGNTWHHMGLKDTHHIGRIVIDRLNPDVAYVAALGHLWGPNQERGLFKTTDGGKTWNNVLFIDIDTGCVDVAIDPSNNNILYAAMYQRRRSAWGFIGGGPGSGLYKTINAGKTWTKLTNGLPEGDTGRIGIDTYRRDPNVVYSIIENKNGGVFRSKDKGETWVKMSSTNPRPMYYSQIRVDPNNDLRIWVLGAQMYTSFDGGKTFRTDIIAPIHFDHHALPNTRTRTGARIHVDFHALWINPANSNHMILGSDGGVKMSYDRGITWELIDNLPIGQFYEIGYDLRKPYNIYGGMQDNWSWKGPSATRHERGITNEDWIRVGGGDGFYNQVDPENQNILYVESQMGNLRRMNLFTEESKSIKPEPKDETETYRFNWNSPILISPHNSTTIYLGGNKLFKSIDRGDTWTSSYDLTTQQDKDKLEIMDVIPDEDTLSRDDGIPFYGDITSVTESPVKEGLLWVGTDDGNVQLSKDGGIVWTNLISNIKGVPKFTYVSRIIASHFVETRAYVSFDGHRSDDFKPYVFVTEDFGNTWKSITNNLPQGGTVNVIREHPRNQNLLFVGTERGAYFSIDRGQNWIKFEGNFPIVPVDDIAIHPRENDLIFGTHGRSIYVLDDITPLEQLNKEILDSEIFLFKIRPAERFQVYNHKGFSDHKKFRGPNPAFGAIITYYLNSELDKEDKILITILDNEGNKISEIKGTQNQGFNRVNWNLRYEFACPEEEGMSAPARPFVVPGEYTVRLTVKGKSMETPVVVELDPRIESSKTDLKAQKDSCLELSDLYCEVTRINQQILSLQDQVKNLKWHLDKPENLDKSIMEDLNSFEEKIDKIQVRLMGVRGQRRSKAVIKDIVGHLNNISGYSAAPTANQKRKIEELSDALEKVSIEMDDLLSSEIPRLNKKMDRLNISFLDPNKKL